MYITESTSKTRMRPSCHGLEELALFPKVEELQNNFHWFGFVIVKLI